MINSVCAIYFLSLLSKSKSTILHESIVYVKLLLYIAKQNKQRSLSLKQHENLPLDCFQYLSPSTNFKMLYI